MVRVRDLKLEVRLTGLQPIAAPAQAGPAAHEIVALFDGVNACAVEAAMKHVLPATEIAS